MLLNNHWITEEIKEEEEKQKNLETNENESRRRKWQPTPVFLPEESQGQRSLVGWRLWGRTESDMTEAT